MTIIWSPLAIERMKEIVRYLGRERPETAENGPYPFLPKWKDWSGFRAAEGLSRN